MKRARKKLRFSKTSKGGIEIITLLIIIFASFTFVGGFSPVKRGAPLSNSPNIIVQNIPASSPANSLQLKTLPIITVAPTPTPIPTQPPTNTCNHDNGRPAQENNGQCVPEAACTCGQWLVECRNNKCFRVISKGDSPIAEPNSCDTPPGRARLDIWCSDPSLTGSGDCVYCLGKPVIYLYPTKKTTVDVKVDVPGKIIESDPFYPSDGWKDVEAYPDGKLIYKGRQYHELYYESAVSKINPPEDGLVVSKNNIEKTLKDLTTKLGLIPFEQKELVDYWLPKLDELNSPYLLISVIDQKEKERIDHVEITPAPDTKIEFLLYFKPLDRLTDIKPLELLKIPKRIGFTSVEWGGTIENN